MVADVDVVVDLVVSTPHRKLLTPMLGLALDRG